MANAVLPKESSAVRCAICARPALRGAPLCAQCKAAVERARHVQRVHAEFLPHRMVAADSGPVPGAFAPSGRARADQAGIGAGGWGTYATLVAFGIAVCLTGYIALGELEEASSALHDSVASHPASPKRGPDADVVAAPAPAVEEPATPAHADASEGAARIEPGTRGPAERRSVREAKQVGSIIASSASDAASEPVPAQDAGPAPAPAPQVVQEAPAPVPDRQQLLAVALSQCERENAVVGLFCKERARLQYCDGQWGAAPQCPVGVASNNTR
jgi:hypothetical protein